MAGKSAVLSDDEDEMEVYDNEEEEDDEDETGQDEYENDGFIVDDEEQEEGGDSDEEMQKKRRRKKRESQKNYVLDEDDYELLEDNNVTGFRRPEESKKFKRLKKAQRDHHSGLSGGNEFDRSGRDVLQHSLFGDDEGTELEDIAEEEQLEEDNELGDEDDLGDFIVEEDLDEHGAPMRRDVTKKKPRQAQGVSSSALQEAHDIFGNVDDLLKRRAYHDGRKERTGGGVDPTIIAEKYMTEKDDLIRNTDFPERWQIFEHSTGPPPTDESSIDEESTWICNELRNMIHLFGRIVEISELSIVKEDVMRFLDFIHIQKLDVPFIAMYRKDECPSLFKDPEQLEADALQNISDGKPALMWHKILWTILDLDKKWLLLQKRKSALQLYYKKRYAEESRIIDDETRLNFIRQLFDSVTKSLKAAVSEREVDDVDSKFNLHFPPGEVGDVNGQYKRPKRRSQYSSCSKAGLWGLVSKLGYSSEQFGLQLSLEKMRMEELLDSKETPEEAALNFICAMFETPQNVLRGARHMAALEICWEPYVRKHVRSIYMDNAVVSTIPTPDGNVAIDASHQYATIKWLREKPLGKFMDAQWLQIQKAEEEKLIKVTLKLPEPVLSKLISDSNENYLSDGVSKSAQLWNEQRKLILQDAFFDFLLPSMEKEARLLLAGRARSWLLLEYGKLLWDRVSVAPYQRKEQDLSSDEEAAPRVMACCWGPGKPATTFVMLDSCGEVLDVLYAGSICNRGQNVNDQQRKKNDQQRVLKFMTEHQPHVVVLGAANLSCTRLKEDIYEIIFKMVEETPREVGHDMDGISILYGDETFPHLYENSRISSDQLPLQSGIVKRAVALGRYLQNPLAMVATLCGPGKEILSWKLSPLEDFLTSDDKFGMIEQIMVDVTNQVGLDVNLALSHEWLFSTMQFISGLGPRKAASLVRSLVRNGAIFTRKDLLTEHGIGKRVFVNSVGFLRVRRTGMAASTSQFIDMLDDTRIHPEFYGLAQELARDVYLEDVQDDTVDYDDDEVLQLAIEHVREKPHLLKSLEVHEYAKSKQLESKIQTLNLIRLELIHGFQDWRKPYAEPSQDEEFCMISGETEDSLAEGRIVQATVRRVLPQKAICVLDSGLVGILGKEDYADDWKELPDLNEKLNEGEILSCKIKSIQKNRYQLFLSCKESEMRNNQYHNHQNLDPHYHEDRSSLPGDQDKTRKQKELGRKYFKPRLIVHPRFQNITADEAVEFLSDKDIGEIVVRPSSRGPSFLTLTLKVYDGIYAHKDIIEGGKEQKDLTSLLRIGKTLKVGDQTFEDLDEVIDRYVDPLVAQLKVMLNYRKFKKGTKAEIDECLRIEKAENPMRIVYCFGISYEHPGTCILTYIRTLNPHHEYVGVYPTGFKFRRKMFGEIDRLVAYFQRHIDDPQKSELSVRSAAAMVPLGSAAIGGQSGGWDDSRSGGDGSSAGRGDFKNGGSQDGHPSGIPRPYGGMGRGRGRGRGSYNGSGRGDGYSSGKQDVDTWTQSDDKWGGNGSGDGKNTGGWDGSGGTAGGWGGSGGGSDGTAAGWGGSGGGTDGTAGGWGGSGGGSDGTAGGWGGSGGGTDGSAGGGTTRGWGGSGGGSEGNAGGWGGSGGGTDGSAGGGTTRGWGGSGGGSEGNAGGWGGSGGGTDGSAGGGTTRGWGGSGGGSEGNAGGWGGSGGGTDGSAGGGTTRGWGGSGGGSEGNAGGWGGSGGGTDGSAGGGTTRGWGGSGGGSEGNAGGWGGSGGGTDGSAGGGTTRGWGGSGGGSEGNAGGWGGSGGGTDGSAGGGTTRGWGGSGGGSEGNAGGWGGSGGGTDGSAGGGTTRGWGGSGGGSEGNAGGWGGSGGGTDGSAGGGTTRGWGGSGGGSEGNAGGWGGSGGGTDGSAGGGTTRGWGGSGGGSEGNAGGWGGSGGGTDGSAGGGTTRGWGGSGGGSEGNAGGWGGSGGGTDGSAGGGTTRGWGGSGGGSEGNAGGWGGSGGGTDGSAGGGTTRGWGGSGGGSEGNAGGWGGSGGGTDGSAGGGTTRGWGGSGGGSEGNAGGWGGSGGGTDGSAGGGTTRGWGGSGGGSEGNAGGWGGSGGGTDGSAGGGTTRGWGGSGGGSEGNAGGWGGSGGGTDGSAGGGTTRGWGGSGGGSEGNAGGWGGSGGGSDGIAGGWGGSGGGTDGTAAGGTTGGWGGSGGGTDGTAGGGTTGGWGGSDGGSDVTAGGWGGSVGNTGGGSSGATGGGISGWGGSGGSDTGGGWGGGADTGGATGGWGGSGGGWGGGGSSGGAASGWGASGGDNGSYGGSEGVDSRSGGRGRGRDGRGRGRGRDGRGRGRGGDSERGGSSWGGGGGGSNDGTAGGWGGGGSSGGAAGGWAASGGDNVGYGGNGGSGGLDSGSSGRGRGFDGRGRGRGRDGGGRGRGGDGESGGSSWGSGGGNRGRGGGGRGRGGRGGSDEGSGGGWGGGANGGGGSSSSWGGSGSSGHWGGGSGGDEGGGWGSNKGKSGGSNSNWGGAGNGGGGNGGGGSGGGKEGWGTGSNSSWGGGNAGASDGGWGSDKGGGSNSSWGGPGNGGGSGGDKGGWGSGSNSSWGGGNASASGGGGGGGWGADVGKGGGTDEAGGSGTGGWGGGSNSGWGGGNAGASGSGKDVPKSGSSGWG
nr:PREDICTED: transcription elongation factor SPT6-like isoform X2 [Daucus carota subsp. sativus]